MAHQAATTKDKDKFNFDDWIDEGSKDSFNENTFTEKDSLLGRTEFVPSSPF